MPARADRSARQDDLAQLAVKLIGTEGMQATTIRRLADLAGYSTAIVTHYFHNKRELLFKVYEYVSETAIAHFTAKMADNGSSVETIIATLLPIGEQERTSWRVVFAFWQLALHDAEFAARQRVAMRHTEELISRLLRERGYRGDAQHAGGLLLVTVMGMSVRSAFEPNWDDEFQLGFLKDILASLGMAEL